MVISINVLVELLSYFGLDYKSNKRICELLGKKKNEIKELAEFLFDFFMPWCTRTFFLATKFE